MAAVDYFALCGLYTQSLLLEGEVAAAIALGLPRLQRPSIASSFSFRPNHSKKPASLVIPSSGNKKTRAGTEPRIRDEIVAAHPGEVTLAVGEAGGGVTRL